MWKYAILFGLLFCAPFLLSAQEQPQPSTSPDFGAELVSYLEKAKLSKMQKDALMPLFLIYEDRFQKLDLKLATSESETAQLSTTLQDERQAFRSQLQALQLGVLVSSTVTVLALAYIFIPHK